MIVVGVLLYWTARSEAGSVTELWLRYVLIAFLANFASNFFFTLFNGVRIAEAWLFPASYFFKTCYHISLCVGVFAWCGYAEAELRSGVFQNKKTFRWLLIPLFLPIVFAVANLRTHWLFSISESGGYVRHAQFQIQMAYLFVCSMICSVRLLRRTRYEADPAAKAHLRLTATFPVCILAAWILSFIGEAVPVICVSIMVELLCLYMGTTTRQISTDKLTQVNNRQNLLGFMEYKLKNNDGSLYLLMIDVDYFKTINDTYGHLEGDYALIRVASALKRACGAFRRRPYIARYGGDEFIIVMEGSEEDVGELSRRIREELTSGAADGKPYELNVSIGAARRQEDMGAKELIAAADEELYKIKHARV